MPYSCLLPLALLTTLLTPGITDVSTAHRQDFTGAGESARLGANHRAPQPAAAAGPVSVTVGLSLSDVHYNMKITSDERRLVTDEAVVTGWMATEWTDDSLARPGGATSRPLRLGGDVWTPDIRHLNTISPSSGNLLLMFNETDAVLDQSGRVRCQSPVQFRVRFFPREGFNAFTIRLGSRLMTTAELDLHPAGDALDMTEYTGWYVKNTWMHRNDTSRAGFAEPFAVIEAGVMPTVI